MERRFPSLPDPGVEDRDPRQVLLWCGGAAVLAAVIACVLLLSLQLAWAG